MLTTGKCLVLPFSSFQVLIVATFASDSLLTNVLATEAPSSFVGPSFSRIITSSKGNATAVKTKEQSNNNQFMSGGVVMVASNCIQLAGGKRQGAKGDNLCYLSIDKLP